MDHDRFSRSSTLHANEGAGMPDLLPILIDECANDKEFFVQVDLKHVILDELLKGVRSRSITISNQFYVTDEFEGPSIPHDQVLEEGQRVASLDLLIDYLFFGLLLPPTSQPMHLFPRDEDRVAKGGVHSIDDAVMDDERYPVRLIEKEVVPAKELALIIHRAVGAQI